MNMRLMFALLACLILAPVAVLAATGQQAEADTAIAPIKPQTLQSCLKPGEKTLNMAQTTQTECCKDHKGVCGCRAGKIVCCDGTASAEPGCACHGDDGFLE